MTRYLIDSNVVVDFQLEGHLGVLVAAAALVPLVIVDQVYEEVAIPASGDRPALVGHKRAAARAIGDSAILVVEILPESPAKTLYDALLRPAATAHDRGEAASIAFARYDASDLVFVTGDKNATFLALNELSDGSERVMRVPVFVRRLYEASAITASVVRAIDSRVNSHGVTPSWWASWLASLPP